MRFFKKEEVVDLEAQKIKEDKDKDIINFFSDVTENNIEVHLDNADSIVEDVVLDVKQKSKTSSIVKISIIIFLIFFIAFAAAVFATKYKCIFGYGDLKGSLYSNSSFSIISKDYTPSYSEIRKDDVVLFIDYGNSSFLKSKYSKGVITNTKDQVVTVKMENGEKKTINHEKIKYVLNKKE